jgi:hypothetical protein
MWNRSVNHLTTTFGSQLCHAARKYYLSWHVRWNCMACTHTTFGQHTDYFTYQLHVTTITNDLSGETCDEVFMANMKVFQYASIRHEDLRKPQWTDLKREPSYLESYLLSLSKPAQCISFTLHSNELFTWSVLVQEVYQITTVAYF